MNKDVIYIEPEDDITDIIAKIENSKEKIVALVPPKKLGVMRSIVNIKLIAKSSINAGKNVVLVTTDPSVIRLAAATRLPVAKNLQSAPVIPDSTTIETEEAPSVSEVVETKEDEAPSEKEPEREEIDKAEGEEAEKENGEETKEEDNEESGKKKDKKHAKVAGQNRFKLWVRWHKKIVIGGSVGLVIFVALLVWAFAIAPAVTVTVGVRTITSNFSENVTFVEKLTEEKVSEGKFYLETVKVEEKTELSFEATGQKNVGEKAKGEVVVYAYFPINGNGGTVAINAGSVFRIDDLAFIADSDGSLHWDGDIKALKEDCENYENEASLKQSGCLVSGKIPVTAEAAGTKYNVSPSLTGWNTTASVGVYSDSAMTGGTDVMVTVVQQSDIDGAIEKLKTSSNVNNKEKLFASIGEDDFAIESSYKHTVGEPTPSPKVGEEVKQGEKAKLVVITTDSVFVLDKTKVEEFITEKAKLAENYKIYSMNDPFIENFLQADNGYIGKLKTSYVSGPKITENDIVEIIKGKGIGVAKHDLGDIDGIGQTKIDTSYPWVMSIPNDPNKITVSIVVEE